MSGHSFQSNTSPIRHRNFNSNSVPRSNNPYRRAPFEFNPSLVSPVRHASISPNTTPSPKRKARSSSSASIFTSFIRALKTIPKSKKRPQKLGSPIRLINPKRNSNCHGKQLPRVRSVPAAGRWDAYGPQRRRRQRPAGLEDEMEMDSYEDDEGCDETGRAQYLYYGTGDNPFTTPPRTPLSPLSPMGLNGFESPDSSPESVRSRKRRAIERSRMKSLQLLGPEASMVVKEQFGNTKRAV